MNKPYNIVFVFTYCNRSGPTQQMLNIARHYDRTLFKPIFVTLYPEKEGNSRYQQYLDAGFEHHYVPMRKLDLFIGNTKALKEKLEELNPAIIHSLGVLPDFAISKMHFKCHVITLRNFIFDDYTAWYGKFMGLVLAKLHLYAMKRTRKTWTCSESLATKYKEKLNLSFEFIQNGVDVERFHTVTTDEKKKLREKLGINQDKKIFIYTGRLSTRKDQEFLLELFHNREELKEYDLLIMTEGDGFDRLKEVYCNDHIFMPGFKPNVDEYLQASDVYISCSKSEGLPNGVLEAMAVGLPVVLSDIPQHLEVYNADSNVGKTFKLGDKEDCVKAIQELLDDDITKMSQVAYSSAHEYFSDIKMSKKYQSEYLRIIEG